MKAKLTIFFILSLAIVGSDGVLHITLVILSVLSVFFIILYRAVDKIMWPMPKQEFENEDKPVHSED